MIDFRKRNYLKIVPFPEVNHINEQGIPRRHEIESRIISGILKISVFRQNKLLCSLSSVTKKYF